MTHPPIIGLSGYAGSGKDAFGLALVHHGYERRAFADNLKALARHAGWNGAKNDAGRELLQNLGHGARQVFGERVWIEAAMRDLPPLAVFTDVRYWNEANEIKRRGGVMVRVSRPGVGPVNGHLSETDLDDYTFDVYLDNDGSLLDLRRLAGEFLERMSRHALPPLYA